MSELFLLPAKAYQVKENIIFLKTDIGNLIYDSHTKELVGSNEDVSDYCAKNKFDIMEVRQVYLEEVIHEEAKVKLDSPFKVNLGFYCKKQNQKNKELNQEMYATLVAGMVVAILGSFLI